MSGPESSCSHVEQTRKKTPLQPASQHSRWAAVDRAPLARPNALSQLDAAPLHLAALGAAPAAVQRLRGLIAAAAACLPASSTLPSSLLSPVAGSAARSAESASAAFSRCSTATEPLSSRHMHSRLLQGLRLSIVKSQESHTALSPKDQPSRQPRSHNHAGGPAPLHAAPSTAKLPDQQPPHRLLERLLPQLGHLDDVLEVLGRGVVGAVAQHAQHDLGGVGWWW
jgi:hypothetical protein